MKSYKKMERKFMDITLQRVEDKPKKHTKGERTFDKTHGFLNHSRTLENHSH